jgi:tetratricopeptide (TPR) repeat protein
MPQAWHCSRPGQTSYTAQRKWPEARGELEQLLKINPIDGKALISLGRAYASDDDVPRATLAFEAAYRVASSTYIASLELANIELKNRHYAKSAEYLEKALSIEKLTRSRISWSA